MANWKKTMMASAGGGGADYWISVYGGSGQEYAYDVITDSSDNIIVIGFTASVGQGSEEFLTVKYDAFGTLQWAKILGGSGQDTGQAVAVDSSDNVIVVGFTTSDGAGSLDGLIAKYNSSGVLQWDRTLGGSSIERVNGVAVDSSDNIIITGQTNSDGAGNYDLLVAKYNSSGSLQWDRTLGGISSDSGQKVVIDSLDNIIIAGTCASDGAGGVDGLIVKYNSSGSLQWDRTLGGFGSDYFYDVAVDSSNNIVVSGTTSSGGAGATDAMLAKYNSSGTLQWQKTVGKSGFENGWGVDVDSSDNIILCGRTNSEGAGNNDIMIVKCNSSGVVQWSTTLGGTGQDEGYSVAIDSSDNIIAVGYTEADDVASRDFVTAKVPPDGTGTGTYGEFTYQSGTITSTTSSFTNAAAVLTDAPAVLTDAPAVLTDASVALTETFYEIT